MALLIKTLTITAVREEMEDVKTLYFEGADATAIPYRPGQYLTLVLPEAEPEVRRSYSITSVPALHEPLSITVKRLPNGIFSRRLVDHAQPGDQLLTIGAGGFFTLPENILEYGQLFFFAAGSGITPCYALIKAALAQHPHLSLTLIYSNASIERTIFRQELLALAQQYPDRFQIEFIFSNNPDLSKARLYHEYLLQLMQKYLAVPPEAALCYLCGPENYMRMCIYGLREAQVPFENIKKETFTSVKKIPKIEPPDTAPHRVSVEIGPQTYTFETQFPDSVLRSAQKAGIQLPYSCEAGRCGSCVAQRLAGELWMSYNEVLTEQNLAQGLVLTCVAHPVHGDARLKIM